jgi:aspartyl/asparaginyl-tRNA synthetase
MELTGRVHKTKILSKKMGFLILRVNHQTIQVFCTGKELVLQLNKINDESVVKVFGTKKECKVKSCDVKDWEINAEKIEILSESNINLPMVVHSDIKSELNTRLSNRWLDLRNYKNFKIFKVQSLICKKFREFFDSNEFIEIHTPKIISRASESGSEVFKLNYFEETAYLAQSPQFYKQMMINSDFKRVYEIGPVFRAEKSLTYRHLTEFTGLDIEMVINESYQEVINTLWKFMVFLLKELSEFHTLVVPENPLMLEYKECLEILNCSKIGTPQEKELGKYVKEKYKTDLFVIINFPVEERAFYTKENKSYDFILRGNEILSGAERENRYEILKNKVDYDLGAYLESFKYGSYRHGGGGFGLERLTMFILDINNIRETSLFPRDPNRIEP